MPGRPAEDLLGILTCRFADGRSVTTLVNATPIHAEDGRLQNKRQQLDHLLRVTAPHERVILAAIGVVLPALAAWALFGSVVRAVTIDGILLEPGPRHDVISTEPGYLLEYLVAPGDRVEAGAPIARQSVPELARETVALRDRVELLEREFRRPAETCATCWPRPGWRCCRWRRGAPPGSMSSAGSRGRSCPCGRPRENTFRPAPPWPSLASRKNGRFRQSRGSPPAWRSGSDPA